MNDTSHTMQWENYVMTMTKHKLLQRMEEFTKQQYPTCEDYQVIAHCYKSLYYHACLQKDKKQ